MRLLGKQIEYTDRIDVSEIFINSMGKCFFTEGVAAIELCVTRLDKPDPSKPPTGKKYPACRLVLTPSAVIELFQSLNGIMRAMEREGIIKANPIPKPTGAQH
ncbi:MAG: hypothetical protein GX846_11415 [Deltaproteobacteria bacterium]|nr:hypothetical protein [Deltaproteobacteria bacterium]